MSAYLEEVRFFFSSRRRHTRSKRDWSSDVCSSDLIEALPVPACQLRQLHPLGPSHFLKFPSHLRRQVLKDGPEVISLTPRLRESPFQEFVEGFQVLQPPVLPRSNFTQITTKFDKASVPFRLLPLFPSQDFVDFGKHEQGSLAIELGQHRRILSN